jgi:enoyl-CoA hydratase/carnithine racemase
MERINLIKNQLNNLEKKEFKFEGNSVLVENCNFKEKEYKEIKIVTLNNPKSLNALSKNFLQLIYDTLKKIDADKETKIIILTGIDKAFAAGADIKNMSKLGFEDVATNDWDFLPIELISYQINKPIIAALNGFTFGGGFELALACDIILASDKAQIAFPELKLGLLPGAGGTQRLTRLMGYHKAMEYILTTKNIPLNEAKAFGVINDIIKHENLMESAISIALDMTKFSLMSIVNSKKAMKMALETSLYGGLKAEKYLFQSLFNTEDKQEGIKAFMEKRKPVVKDK